MPDSLDAALTFAPLIVPGYQLVRGYAVVRGAGPPDEDLYVLAQAIVASLAWLAVTWPAIDEGLRRIGTGEAPEGLATVGYTAPVLLGLPYLVGRAFGALAGAASRPDNPWGPAWLASTVTALGLAGQETVWETTWRIAKQQDTALVTLSLDDDRSITGQYGRGSYVATSPSAPAVYLERAYERRDDGQVVVYDHGAYVDGARIVAVKIGV